MRACNGCRKRKIKCDAATTNTWPCSACTRLKLVCVPPTIGQDSDFSVESNVEAGPAGSLSAHDTSEPPLSSFPVSQNLRDNSQPSVGAMQPYTDALGMFPQFSHSNAQHPGVYEVQSPQVTVPNHSYQQPQMFSASQGQALAPMDSSIFGEPDSTAEGLSEVLGELKIDETGIGKVDSSSRLCWGRPKSGRLLTIRQRLISGNRGERVLNRKLQYKMKLRGRFLLSILEPAPRFESPLN